MAALCPRPRIIMHHTAVIVWRVKVVYVSRGVLGKLILNVSDRLKSLYIQLICRSETRSCDALLLLYHFQPNGIRIFCTKFYHCHTIILLINIAGFHFILLLYVVL